MKDNVNVEVYGSHVATTTKHYYLAEARATRSILHGASRHARCPDTRSKVPSLCGGECNWPVKEIIARCKYTQDVTPHMTILYDSVI